ncbi:MAG: hypothetical protein ACREFS_12555 [Acetobacteraceae bacterium]
MRPNSSVRIRPVSPDQSQSEQSFDEAAQAVLARALADGATVLMVAWENPSGQVTGISVPGSGALLRGLVETLAETILGDDRDAE